MGRVTDKHQVQVKNTFVEIVANTNDADFTRSQRTSSDTGANERYGESPATQTPYIPQTPSPFLGAHPDPCFMPYPMLDQSQLGGGPALAFGDFGPEECGQQIQGYNCGEAAAQFGPALQYDPNTGAYFMSEYTFMPFDANCYNMVSQEQMQGDQIQQDMTAGEDQIQVPVDGSLDQTSAVPGNGNGNSEDMGGHGDMEGWENAQVECWEGTSWGHGGNYGNYGEEQQLGAQQGQQSSSRRKSERREAREAARRQERAAAAASISAEGQGGNCAQEDAKNAARWDGQASVNKSSSGGITTVMFRNIPNKYTREMLVQQLDQDMKGLFDFIYLPIDFKNKCNVGYAFINFRTVEACDAFVNRFNGVEVRKCLPGLNSRKVTEVTPARVQGFEENVQRLRNSPVMRELVHKPEWMPLIFDYNGDQVNFPAPERPLEPIKPRRRARDEEARLL